MSNEKIVDNIISFIEDKERELQRSIMSNTSSGNIDNSEVVTAIINELEREIKNEDK